MTLLLTNGDLAQLIAASEFVEELDRAYRAYAAGVGVCPPRIDVQSAALGGGRNYQLGLAVGMADRYAALRIKSDVVFREIVEGRERKNKYCVEPGRYMGLVLVFDRADGALLAILHDGLLQKMRVGADSALGVRYLAREDAATIGILGSGGMARTHIAAVSAVRPIRRVIIFSPTEANRTGLAREVRAEHDLDAAAVDRPEAVYAADIVSSCASAMGPMILGRCLRPGTHVTCIGGSLDAEANGRIDVALRFGDAPAPVEAPSLQTGDEALTFVEGTEKAAHGGTRRYADVPPARRISFADLLSNPSRGRRNEEQITFSERGNIHGIEFAAVAGHLYEKAQAAGLGQILPSSLFLQSIRN
jgi:alanine dehydrogenase